MDIDPVTLSEPDILTTLLFDIVNISTLADDTANNSDDDGLSVIERSEP